MSTTDVDLRALGLSGTQQLARIAATVLEEPPDGVTVSEWTATEVPYDIDALTTAGRLRIRGTASTRTGERAFAVFVKSLRSWEHHPAFVHVPEPFRDLAVALLPWAVELDVYRTDLRAALPAGLSMPRTYAVCDLDSTHGTIWMEAIELADRRWDVAEVAQAARRLGRFAASPAVREALEPLRPTMAARTVRHYYEGRLTLQVLPAIATDELWSHPSVRRHFGRLRAPLETAVARLPELVDELEHLPYGTAHGDASTRNLLTRAATDHQAHDRDDHLVMIDFGFLSRAPLGFDLSQLLLGQVQLGERPAADLPALAAAAHPAYVEGLRDLGDPTDAACVDRAAAICGFVFSGVSAVPFEQLAGADPRAGRPFDRWCAERAGMLEFVLDRLARTEVRRPLRD